MARQRRRSDKAVSTCSHQERGEKGREAAVTETARSAKPGYPFRGGAGRLGLHREGLGSLSAPPELQEA